MLIKTQLLVARAEEHEATSLCARIVQAGEGAIAGNSTRTSRALWRAAQTVPDVLLLEHTARGSHSALEVLSRITQVSRSTRVLLLCDAYTHQSVVTFIQHGANGCMLSSNEPWFFAKAVIGVHRGEIWFGRTDLLQALRSRLDNSQTVLPDLPLEQELLTPREREIFALIGNAMSNKEIARYLKISDLTVKTHLHRIYVKLEKSGRYKAFLSKAFAAPGLKSAALARLQ